MKNWIRKIIGYDCNGMEKKIENLQNELFKKYAHELADLKSKNESLFQENLSKESEIRNLKIKIREQNEADLLLISERICQELRSGAKKEDIQELLNQQDYLWKQQATLAQMGSLGSALGAGRVIWR